jgi:hypothetical protein
MRFTQLGAATALVAATQAFLLPPTITSADSDIINTLPFEDAVDIKDRVVEIDCPGCPVVVADIEGKMHSAQVENVLRLKFSLSLKDNDELFMNDVQIYPIDPRSTTFMEPLTADQLVKSPAGTWEYAASPKLGYGISVSHPATSNNEQLDLVNINIEILEVADTFVNGIDAVLMKVLETPSGKLMIGDVEIIPIPTQSPTSKPTDGNQECATMICKWRAIIADKLSKIKGCAGKARPGAHGSKHSSGVRPHGHGRPRPQGPHRPHRHHHRHGGFARFFRSIVLHVFIPIMIGVVVGVTTSLIGMVVGHIIIFVWRVLFRRGQRGQYRKVQQEETLAKDEDDETKSFVNHQGPPPTYEEAPAYEAAVVDEKASQ